MLRGRLVCDIRQEQVMVALCQLSCLCPESVFVPLLMWIAGERTGCLASQQENLVKWWKGSN